MVFPVDPHFHEFMFCVSSRLDSHFPGLRLARVDKREGTTGPVNGIHEYGNILRHSRPSLNVVKETKPAMENGSPVPRVDPPEHELDQ